MDLDTEVRRIFNDNLNDQYRRIERIKEIDDELEILQSKMTALKAEKMRISDVKTKEAVAYDLRNTGLTFREIGEYLGISTPRATQMFYRHERRLNSPPPDDLGIEALGLSVRPFNALRRNNIRTIKQLTKEFKDGNLESIENIGDVAIEEIKFRLEGLA